MSKPMSQRYAKALKTRNPESHAKMSSDSGFPFSAARRRNAATVFRVERLTNRKSKIVHHLARRSVRHLAMAMLSLLEAAKEVGKSKSSIWRAAKSGALSVTKNDAGQFMVDSSELFRVFQAKRSEPRGVTQDAAVHVTHEADDTLVRLAVYEAKLEALQAMVQELRQSRDHWQAQAERLALTAPIAVSPAPSPAHELPPFHHTARAGAVAAPAPVPAPDQRRSWRRRPTG